MTNDAANISGAACADVARPKVRTKVVTRGEAIRRIASPPNSTIPANTVEHTQQAQPHGQQQPARGLGRNLGKASLSIFCRPRFRLGVVVPHAASGAVRVGVIEELDQLIADITDSVPIIVTLIRVCDWAVDAAGAGAGGSVCAIGRAHHVVLTRFLVERVPTFRASQKAASIA
jgi:hypothetical protein